MCNHDEAMAILEEVCKRSADVLPVSDVYLYGSYARGDCDDESDVDIMLLSSLAAEEIWPKRRRISDNSDDISLRHDVTVSVCVRSQESFQPDIVPLHRNVIKEGIRY